MIISTDRPIQFLCNPQLEFSEASSPEMCFSDWTELSSSLDGAAAVHPAYFSINPVAVPATSVFTNY